MKYIQVSDTHIFSEKDKELFNINTYAMLERVVSYIQSENRHDSDGMLITGDISQDGSMESYDLAFSLLSKLSLPMFWIHGNHDVLDNILKSSEKYHAERLSRLDGDGWGLVAIDSTFGNNDSGSINDNEMDKLSKLANENKQISLVMHHHPVRIGTPLVDACNVENGEEFMRHVGEIDAIKLIICGHVHGEYNVKMGELKLETCPAACFQWKKGTAVVETEAISGYKILEFSTQGHQSQTIYLR
ncbi:MAG: metallophosphoesterase [Paludibacterium sp.]|uniref:metallophosphoesterase n=1 Tax=Paludibacterium sp. TaxID=1917523 RepID=UPI0025E6CFEA|nr:metallophosphoesterase [Paludibacterium sp.]MBV8048102.1 metallophosphoesterase [Paludibacterium sp.]MBV8647026.1 metallophosphoesterase [Paludibacterium sp.]